MKLPGAPCYAKDAGPGKTGIGLSNRVFARVKVLMQMLGIGMDTNISIGATLWATMMKVQKDKIFLCRYKC